MPVRRPRPGRHVCTLSRYYYYACRVACVTRSRTRVRIKDAYKFEAIDFSTHFVPKVCVRDTCPFGDPDLAAAYAPSLGTTTNYACRVACVTRSRTRVRIKDAYKFEATDFSTHFVPKVCVRT